MKQAIHRSTRGVCGAAPSGGRSCEHQNRIIAKGGQSAYFWRDCPAKNRFVWRYGLKDATETIILARLRYQCPSVILSLFLRLALLRTFSLARHAHKPEKTQRKKCNHKIVYCGNISAQRQWKEN